MCGIAGYYGGHRRLDVEELKKMGKSLTHRGPDGEGLWVDYQSNIGLVHRRLSIIDLSENASQPMHYLGRYSIVFNGEIYNYIELKEELLQKGYKFKTNSDTEVLLALYADLGVNCFKRIDGMFAFAIWDNERKVLLLARDRFGEKPLYYCFIDGAFCFASEMKALFAIGASKETSPDRVYKYLASNILVDAENIESTLYKQISQLDAANFIVIKDAQVQMRTKYWNLEGIPIDHKITLEEAAHKFNSLFSLSIKRRMRSDVPIGSSLSGGIDSSSIVLFANRNKEVNQIQSTFSARFNNFAKDEGHYIDLITSKLEHIKAYKVWPSVDRLIEEIENLAYYQEEPFTSGSIYNQYCVMRLAKENDTTVLLDGQGADEQLGGYLQYYFHHLTHLIISNPRQFLIERRKYQIIHRDRTPYRIPRRLPLWYLKKVLFKSEFVYDDDVRALLKRDTTSTFLKELLRYGDRNSMAFSREVRLPFLFHELTEFIFSLPIDFILRDGWTKFILRKSMEDTVPDEIVWRKDKIGFEPPQDSWVQRLKPMIDDYKTKTNYLDFTDGRIVNDIGDWKWLMMKLFVKNGD